MNTFPQKLITTLERIGMDYDESLIYLTLLHNPSASVSDISLESGIKRTSVYHVIERLKQKHLLTEHNDGVKKKYTVEPPAKLKDILTESSKLMDEALPELESIFYKQSSTRESTHYHGEKAIKQAYISLVEACTTGDTFQIIGSEELWHSKDSGFFHKLVEHLAMKGAVSQIILTGSIPANTQQNQIIKLLSVDTPLCNNIVITPHAVLTHRTANPQIAVVQYDQNVIQAQQQVFGALYNTRLN